MRGEKSVRDNVRLLLSAGISVVEGGAELV